MAGPESASTGNATRLIGGALTLFAAAWVWQMIRFWGIQPDYADRFLILLAAGWLAYQAWPEISARPAKPSVLGLPFVLVGAVLFPVGWYLFVQIGPRIILTWIGYLSLLAMAVGALAGTRGWAAVRRLAFPLFFLSVALQLPGRIYDPLQRELQILTTTLAYNGLVTVGIPVVREGHVLRLPGGDLGVIEACSGIRSITALTAIALFLAHVRSLGFVRGLVALLCAIPVIVLVNAVRVLVTGLLQEGFGQAMIMGWKHEVLGFAAVFLGLAMVAAITALLRPKTAAAPPPPPAPTAPGIVAGRRLAYGLGVCLVIGLALTVAATFSPRLTTDAAGETIDRIPPAIDARTADGDLIHWTAKADIPIPEELQKELSYTFGWNRHYKDVIGTEVVVFAFQWNSAASVTGYHHPDICLPSRGYEPVSKGVEPVRLKAGTTLPVTYRDFRQDRNRLAVAYWTQEGRRVWTEADETAAFSFRYPFTWIRERFKPRPPGEVDDRLVVWCFAVDWTTAPSGKARYLEFISALADAVYEACPWAAPRDSASSR